MALAGSASGGAVGGNFGLIRREPGGMTIPFLYLSCPLAGLSETNDR
jgi:hypothetical protein